jgi:tRNA G18 (ribose-2'-O)-methylase SpoU
MLPESSIRLSQKERNRRIRDAQIEAMRSSYNVEQDPGLRDVYAKLPRAPIHLVCCQLVKDVNQGGLLRLAEAYRIEEVVYSPEADGATDFAGSRGTRVWQPFRWMAAEDSVAELKEQGVFTVAITLSDRAVPLADVQWKFPLALVVGEERFGVPSYVEEQCDVSAAIPLYGLVTSLNVATAAAIALNAATSAYAADHLDFQPARGTSRKLLGLPDMDYESEA